MNFREFLLEKAMNAKTFGETEERLKDTAYVGFEFEMLVPIKTPMYQEPEQTRSSQVISYYDTLEEFSDVFEINRTTEQRIERDFNEWLEDKRQDWIDKHYEDYIHHEDEEDRKYLEKVAREEAAAEYDNTKEYEFVDWLRDGFKYRYDFVDAYDSRPKYGWYDDSPRYASVYTEEETYGANEGTKEAIAESLSKLFKVKIVPDEGGKKDWKVIDDGSIDGKGHGVEVCTPPLPLQKALGIMYEMFTWMSKNNIVTNDTTGFHVNVSIPGFEHTLDKVKLVLFAGESHMLEMFKRRGNPYTKPQMQTLLYSVEKFGKIPKGMPEMIAAAEKALSDQKYAAINFIPMKESDPYIEIRAAGNQNYHRNFAKMKEHVLKIVTALEIACEPNAEKQEYARKLGKIFSASPPSEDSVGEYTSTLPEDLERLNKFLPLIKVAYTHFVKATKSQIDYPSMVSINARRHACLILIDTIFKAAKKGNTSPTFKEKAYIQQIKTSCNLTKSDFDEYYSKDHISRLEITKAIGI